MSAAELRADWCPNGFLLSREGWGASWQGWFFWSYGSSGQSRQPFHTRWLPNAPTHTCVRVYVAAHSLHLPCAVPQHNMLVLVYSFLTVSCNGCSACCPTRGISLFIRHAVVSLCLSLAPPCYGASNQPGSSHAVGYTFGGMLLWCQWELIDKSRSLSQLPMSCLSAGKKTIEMEWETDRERWIPCINEQICEVRDKACLWMRPPEGHIADRTCAV